MFKKNFLGTTNFGGAQQKWGPLPMNAPVATGLLLLAPYREQRAYRQAMVCWSDIGLWMALCAKPYKAAIQACAHCSFVTMPCSCSVSIRNCVPLGRTADKWRETSNRWSSHVATIPWTLQSTSEVQVACAVLSQILGDKVLRAPFHLFCRGLWTAKNCWRRV